MTKPSYYIAAAEFKESYLRDFQFSALYYFIGWLDRVLKKKILGQYLLLYPEVLYTSKNALTKAYKVLIICKNPKVKDILKDYGKAHGLPIFPSSPIRELNRKEELYRKRRRAGKFYCTVQRSSFQCYNRIWLNLVPVYSPEPHEFDYPPSLIGSFDSYNLKTIESENKEKIFDVRTLNDIISDFKENTHHMTYDELW